MLIVAHYSYSIEKKNYVSNQGQKKKERNKQILAKFFSIRFKIF